MRILHTVEHYHPSVGGAQEVVRQISERLAARGHEIVVATSRHPDRTEDRARGVTVREFSVEGNAVRGITGEAVRYQRFLREERFDVMLNYAAQQWATDLALPLLEELPYPAVLAPCGFSALHDPTYRDYFRTLAERLSAYERLVLHSTTYRDAAFVREHGLWGNVAVVPNGADEREFANAASDFRARNGIGEDHLLLLTVGSHVRSKGHALAIDAFGKARIGRAVLVVAGNTIGGPGCLPDCQRRAARLRVRSFGRRRVLLLDGTRADVLAAFAAADLFVFASRVECSPIVLFEAMASRTPFISLAAGNAEEIAAWGGGGRVLDGAPGEASARRLADAIEALAGSPALRAQLADAGHETWRERFTWERVARLYEELYEELV